MKMRIINNFVQQENGILYINKLPLHIKTLNFDFVNILNNLTPLEIYISVTEILDLIKGITASGFLPTIDLRKFPIIRAFLFYVLNEKEITIKGKTISCSPGDYIKGKNAFITYR